MAVPKHKLSRPRTRRRRAMWRLKPPALIACPRCHAPCRPHHVCLECGYYRGRQVLVVDED
jgi:large subunit ribosomal protein L32